MTILSSSPIMENGELGWILLTILFILLILFCILFFIFDKRYQDRAARVAFIIYVVCIIFIIADVTCLLCGTFLRPTDRYEYQVLLDDEISFLEVYENYDVVEQNGLIWTLQDKEND